MKRVLLIIMLLFLLFSVVACKNKNENDTQKQNDVEEYFETMTTRDKVSQMLMMACRKRDNENLTSMKNEIATLVKEYGFGGIILFAENTQDNLDIFNLISDYQESNKEGNHPGLFMAVDQEGGRVVRLNEGTTTPGNMALGATGSLDDVKEIASLIASEVDALGFNVDFAPVTDINNNPNNPVIGVRSFSDDKMMVSNMVRAYLSGLKENNVIGSLKHFPGHGDTGTDSHTGLPLINKTLDDLLDFELVPYIENIKDIDMIMTAHIVYPQIETNIYKSKSTYEDINLPATLSKTIITDVLRNRLGYDGVVVTDALNMAAIAEHFEPLDVARLAINAGADILLMPVDISTDNGIEELRKYIDDIVKLVDEGKIDKSNIDNAVMRILKLKDKYNILNYCPKDDSKVSMVGSKDNHDVEWEITKKAITLIKNDGALPIKDGDSVLIITTDSGQTNSVKYASELSGKELTIIKIEDALKIIDGIGIYDKVIIISQMANNKYFTTGLAESINKIIDAIKAKGKKVILLSANLPYDVSCFSNADALVICYNPKGMDTSPVNPLDGQIKQYGPNIPCAICMMLNDTTYTGKLPIKIYKLNSDFKYTDDVLFERGFGLNK